MQVIRYARIFSVVCTVALFAGIMELAAGYYTALRILVSGVAMLIVFIGVDARRRLWPTIFLVVAILFNPVFPVFLYDKSIWIPVDVCCGALFLIWALRSGSRHASAQHM